MQNKSKRKPKPLERQEGLYRSWEVENKYTGPAAPVNVQGAVIETLEPGNSGELERLNRAVQNLIDFNSKLLEILHSTKFLAQNHRYSTVLEGKDLERLLPGFKWVDGPLEDEE